MKRFWTVLLVVAVTLVMALPAGAVKPAIPGKPPPDEPLVGLTCAEAADVYRRNSDATWQGDRTFTVELGVRQDACVDVLSVAGNWIVTVDMGSALEVGMGVQDSVAPGDTCWGGCAGGGVGVFTEGVQDMQFYTPKSAVNACDGVATDPEPDFGDGAPELAFRAWASYRGKAATPATITVTVPPLP